MRPTEARALAERLFSCGIPEPGLALHSLADQVEALQGQALSSLEREEYFAMKTDALRYRWLRDESWKGASLSAKYCFISNQGDGLDDAIDRAQEAT